MEPEVVILTAPTEKQIEELLVFHNENFPDSQWSLKLANKFLQAGEIQKVCIVLRVGSKLMATAIAAVDISEKAMLLAAIAVDKNFRNRGYSKILIKELYKKTLDNNLIEQVVLAFRQSKKLEQFYTAYGFSDTFVGGKYNDGDIKRTMAISRQKMLEYVKKT